MQKITTHLWFDKEAREAAEFYASLFPDSEVKNITTITDTPSSISENEEVRYTSVEGCF